MRKTLFGCICLSFGLLSLLMPATAQAAGQPRAYYFEFGQLNSNLNVACAPGQVKDFVVRIWVKRGAKGRIVDPGEAELRRRNGSWLKPAAGQVFGKRRAEYHATTSSRLVRLMRRAGTQGVQLIVNSAGTTTALNGSVTKVCLGAGT